MFEAQPKVNKTHIPLNFLFNWKWGETKGGAGRQVGWVPRTRGWSWSHRSGGEVSNYESVKSLVLQMRKLRGDGQRFATVLQLVHENSVPKYVQNSLMPFTSCFFLWLPSPPLYSWGLHTRLSCCPIHWVSAAPSPEGRPHDDSEKQEETGKEAGHKGWGPDSRPNVPATLRPVVRPRMLQEMIDPQSCPHTPAAFYPGTRGSCHSSSWNHILSKDA